MVMMIAGIGLLNTQFHQTTDQEQEEKAFGAADAGVQYAYWLLRSGNINPQTLPGQQVIQPVTDPDTGETSGTFTLDFTWQPVGGFDELTVFSSGQDVANKKTQAVVAKIQAYDAGGGTIGYYIKSWDHQP